ncbi:MAG: hypothetical protein IJ171_02700, partial [Ruminococcus sp.]|nr:hypothetical protein [Ruminococcus sp.]
MKNFSKILCVVLALVVALSAASCAMAPQTAYEKDGIKLPIGVYIYYMYTAYTSAQGFAQKSDLYDASTGKYDGKKSFLKMEITDDDGNKNAFINYLHVRNGAINQSFTFEYKRKLNETD